MTEDKKPNRYEIQEVSVGVNEIRFNVWGLYSRFLRPPRRVLIGGAATREIAETLIANDIKYPFTVRVMPYNNKGALDVSW